MTGPRAPAPPRPAAAPPAGPLLPPRPNPGPVPWSEEPSAGGPGPLVVGMLLAALAILFSLVLIRRRRRPVRPAQPAPPEPADLESLDPSSRHLAAAEILRAALAARHGPAHRARTTEEILADPALLAALGPDRLRQLGSILSAADRIKFSGPASAPTGPVPSAESVAAIRSDLLALPPEREAPASRPGRPS